MLDKKNASNIEINPPKEIHLETDAWKTSTKDILTENVSHRCWPPNENATGQNEAAFLHLTGSVGCR